MRTKVVAKLWLCCEHPLLARSGQLQEAMRFGKLFIIITDSAYIRNCEIGVHLYFPVKPLETEVCRAGQRSLFHSALHQSLEMPLEHCFTLVKPALDAPFCDHGTDWVLNSPMG